MAPANSASRRPRYRAAASSSARRERMAELTERGIERLREAAPTHVAGIRRSCIDRFSAAELDQLAEFWRRLR